MLDTTTTDVYIIVHLHLEQDDNDPIMHKYLIPATPAVDAYLGNHTRRRADAALVNDLQKFNDLILSRYKTEFLKDFTQQSVSQDDFLKEFSEESLNINNNGVVYGRTADSPNADPDRLIDDKIFSILSCFSALCHPQEGRIQQNFNIVGVLTAYSDEYEAL